MARFLRTSFFCVALLLVFHGLAVAGVAGPARIHTFDVPGSTSVYPTGINSAGTVTGFYLASTTDEHGFVRDRSGALTMFDVPGSTRTIPQGINGAGLITGYYFSTEYNSNGDPESVQHGFLRLPDGTIETFDVPDDITNPAKPWHTSATVPTVINSSGAIGGYYRDHTIPASSQRARGFVRESNGTFKTFSPEDTTDYVHIFDMNPSGTLVGELHYDLGPYASLLQERNGTFELDFLGRASSFTDINPSGQIIGFASSIGSFLLDRDGTVRTFTVPGSAFTLFSAIDSAGNVAGEYVDANGATRGFIWRPRSAYKTFNVPSAVETHPVEMNSQGDVVGWYSDANGVIRCFVRIRN